MPCHLPRTSQRALRNLRSSTIIWRSRRWSYVWTAFSECHANDLIGPAGGLQSLLDQHQSRIEYLVGSIHHVNAVPIDFDEATFRRALEAFPPDLSSEMSEEDSRMSALLDSYLDSQFLLMQRFHPEIIGHLDLCRLYRPELEFRTFPGALTRLQRNIQYACGYGALFELNAAAFRKGWDSAYPGRDVLQVSQQ